MSRTAKKLLLFAGSCLIQMMVLLDVCAQQTGQKSTAEDTLKIETTLVSVPVIVSDRQGRYISGLKAEDFTLYEDHVKRQIDFFADTEEAINVALLLDTSKSTTMVLDDIKKAAKDFIKQLRPQDRAMIASFDFEAQALSELTSDRKTLERAINKARIGEQFGTKLRDAVFAVMKDEFKSVKGRKAIVLLTDGKDFGSQISEQTLIENAAEADALIYSIFYTSLPKTIRRTPGGQGGGRVIPRGRGGGIFTPRFPPPRQRPDKEDQRQRRNGRIQQRNEVAINFLQELSEVSAGRYFNSQVTDLKKTFTQIVEELRHQYRLGFYPPDHQPGSIHNLRVEVAQSDVAVRSRRTYRISDDSKADRQ